MHHLSIITFDKYAKGKIFSSVLLNMSMKCIMDKTFDKFPKLLILFKIVWGSKELRIKEKGKRNRILSLLWEPSSYCTVQNFWDRENTVALQIFLSNKIAIVIPIRNDWLN